MLQLWTTAPGKEQSEVETMPTLWSSNQHLQN